MFLLLVLMVSFLASALSLKLLLQSPFAKYFGDAPNYRKVHQAIVPRLGGLGMIVGFLIVFGLRTYVPAMLWPLSGNHFSGTLVFIAVFLAGAGTLDFKPKFLLQFI